MLSVCFFCIKLFDILFYNRSFSIPLPQTEESVRQNTGNAKQCYHCYLSQSWMFLANLMPFGKEFQSIYILGIYRTSWHLRVLLNFCSEPETWKIKVSSTNWMTQINMRNSACSLDSFLWLSITKPIMALCLSSLFLPMACISYCQ